MRRLVDDAAVAALESSTLIPPPRPPGFPDGPTAELRDAMARFSTGDQHRDRRRAVEAAVASLDLDLLAREVAERTRALSGDVIDDDPEIEAIADLGMIAPTQALLATLQVRPTDIVVRAADVSTVVAAIGRGAPVTSETEAATRRLMAEFAHHPNGPVAAISLLYQNHDATNALFASALLARASQSPRENALARTVRQATEATRVAAESVESAEVVEVSLDGDDLEFGHGEHACPGQTVAVLIVDAMVATIELIGLRVDLGASTIGADGRALALPLVN